MALLPVSPSGALSPLVPEKQRQPHTFSYKVDLGAICARVRLTVKVPVTLSTLGKLPKTVHDDALTIEQELDLVPSGSNVTIVPLSSNAPGPGGKRALHPRMSFGPSAPGSPNEVRFDLGFIDVTNVLRARRNPQFERYDDPTNSPNPSDIHYGCTLRVLELTLGRPRTWVVAIPPICRERGTVHPLVFYRPSLYRYTYRDSLDIDLSMKRMFTIYLCDPPACAPFFWWGCSTPPGWWLPDAGWEAQIVRSGKPVLFIMPIPQPEADDEDASPRRVTKATDQGLRDLLLSLLTALWADGHLNVTRGDAPGLGNLTIAGLSYGGSSAYTALHLNATSVK
jgi:hypothetical protein